MKGVRFVADKDKDTNINPSVNRRRALMVNTKFTNYLNDVSTSAMGNAKRIIIVRVSRKI